MAVRPALSFTDTRSAWECFVASGKIDYNAVRAEIADSWLRCHKAGVDPNNGSCNRFLSPPDITEMLERNHDLISIAKPFMTQLYKFFEGSGFIVVLVDKRGYIIESFGDLITLKDASKINFVRGASWIEEEVGTNAIGTALILKKPIQISGPEHYCRKHHTWTCSSAPIFDMNNHIIGVLDISGDSDETHLHTLGMVVAAVEAITRQFSIEQKNRELTLFNKRLTNIFNTMSDGVIEIDRNGIIKDLNPVAKRLIGTSGREVIGSKIVEAFGNKFPNATRILENKGHYVDVEHMIDTVNGLSHCLVSCETISDKSGFVTGGILILRPIEKVQSLVNRFSGYYNLFKFSDIISSNTAIDDSIRVASLAAGCMSNVLLQGESGTGKELFAQAIHSASARHNGPFIAVNCGAIPRELIASELFGYEEGAFTGARRGGKPGKFEFASGGTLFLDEIGEMPLEQQVALLRVIQEKKVTRIGSDKVIGVDVRIICATNKNLLKEVEKGAFRQDLYYRLNVISITLPPLRERRNDIVLLFNQFLKKTAHGKEYYVEPQVLEHMQQYDWPGNVRELQNVVERLVSLAQGNTIGLSHLPAEIFSPPKMQFQTSTALPEGIISSAGNKQERKSQAAENERRKIVFILDRCGGNVTRAAEELGFSRNTLYRKMRLYGIEN